MHDSELYTELMVVMLGSNVKYEMAITYAITASKYIESTMDMKYNYDSLAIDLHELLSTRAKNRSLNKTFSSYRFPNKAARNISISLKNIFRIYGSLRNLLMCFTDYKKLRIELIRICPGIGLKQASHFLKNIGFIDKIAVIDSHVMKYMKMSENITISKCSLSNIYRYQDLEKIFISSVCKKFNYPIPVIDQSIWLIMRNLSEVI